MHIIAFSGSLRKESFNTRVLRLFQEQAPDDMQIEIISLADLPLFNQDEELNPPESVITFKRKIESADGLLIATPEYNRSMPGVLKNAIDWGSRPYGKNSFAGKPVLICGVSIGKTGTAIAQHHLRNTLLFLGTKVLGQPELYIGPASEVFDADGKADETTKQMLTKGLMALREQIMPHPGA